MTYLIPMRDNVSKVPVSVDDERGETDMLLKWLLQPCKHVWSCYSVVAMRGISRIERQVGPCKRRNDPDAS